MILLIDNYDSFTYNLYHYLIQAGAKKVVVERNDKISLAEIRELKPQGIVLSPGPCTPNEAGICLEVIKELKDFCPIFGVCLGHQAIGQAFGGNVVKTYPMHGKISEIYHQGDSLFQDLPSPFKATRYHSLVIEEKSLPECLEVTARSEDQEIMGVRHKTLPLWGVQFHPESILTPSGKKMLENFLRLK